MHFYKYHGTGNDFILLDGLNQTYDHLDTQKIALLCHRRFGIGADGLIIMRPSILHSFKMEYYNSDGNLASMCGNGARCISKLFFDLNPQLDTCQFEAVDGLHQASLTYGLVRLSMHTQSDLTQIDTDTFQINTGSPHYVKIVKDQTELEKIVAFGKSIRYSDHYTAEGINVNMVHQLSTDAIVMATYERGVEDETYSCGTGVVAAAIVQSHIAQIDQPINVKTKGGTLSVEYKKEKNTYADIHLTGPAKKVFEGDYYL